MRRITVTVPDDKAPAVLNMMHRMLPWGATILPDEGKEEDGEEDGEEAPESEPAPRLKTAKR